MGCLSCGIVTGVQKHEAQGKEAQGKHERLAATRQ